MSWYDTIEPGIRSVVRLLRDNGFNTECSCEHERYVQCAYSADGELARLDNLLFNAGYCDYSLEVEIIREDGHGRSRVNLVLGKAALRARERAREKP